MGHWRKILKKLKGIILLALVIILTGYGNSNEAEVNKQEETTTTDEFVNIGIIGSSKSMGTCKSEMNP